MRIALVVYLLIFALVSINIPQVLDLSLWFSVIAILLAAGAVIAVHFWTSSSEALNLCLSTIGFIALAAIALTFAIPAWEIIDSGSSGAWTQRLFPMFFAALGLYGAGLWLSAASASNFDALDWLANFLSGPGLLLSLLTASVLCTASLLGLEWTGDNWEASSTITKRFLERGIIPPATILLFYWGVLLLVGKWWNTLYLRRTISQWNSATSQSANSHADRARSLSHEPEKLEDRIQFLWRRHDESFVIPRYISWAVPVLGFIGTVLGISLAADGIRGLIASESGLSGLSSELGAAIAPLGIAFDTTLIALTLSVFLTLFLALVQRVEERTLTSMERKLRESVRVQ